MYYIIWSYRIAPANKAQFEKEYSRNGGWFKFFEECEDYLGTELVRNEKDGSYLLIDKWISRETYEDFLGRNSTKYDQLKARFENLYTEETRIGEYTAV